MCLRICLQFTLLTARKPTAFAAGGSASSLFEFNEKNDTRLTGPEAVGETSGLSACPETRGNERVPLTSLLEAA